MSSELQRIITDLEERTARVGGGGVGVSASDLQIILPALKTAMLFERVDPEFSVEVAEYQRQRHNEEMLLVQRRQTERLEESLELQRQATESQVRTNKLLAQKLEIQMGLQARIAVALEKLVAAVDERGIRDV